MKDPKVNVRYLGFYALTDGGRRFEFSFSGPDSSQHLISVEAPHDLFAGPDHMSIQECPGICYETFKVLSRRMLRNSPGFHQSDAGRCSPTPEA